ncbi:haloacid dehalogenase-like hydrolase [gut metagenome]|uniref:Haloacid dehalogenase-like hydrolase n=1 Tax=gut metagenome TaxID=749906 RepID=J9DCB9_9ZZZZ
MKQTYRLLVLDLDGTLTNSKKEITPRNLKALIRLQQNGTRLVLASGRPTYGIAPLADQLEMREYSGYILSYNGGEIIDWSTGEMLYKNLLPDEVLPILYKTAVQNNQAILTYDNEYILTENPEDKYVLKEAFLNKMKIRPVENFLESIPRPIPKCLIVGEPAQLMQTEAELSLKLQRTISVYRSEPYFLELVPLGIDKARSLAVLLEKLKMTREEMVAMGDGYNDLSMIEFAGMGVAMANAQEPVKQAADYITLSNDEDGVAAAIEKLF